MTVEEIEILVQANIQDALKEFKKLVPAIKKEIAKVSSEVEKINIKDIAVNVNVEPIKKQTNQIKKQIKEAFDPNDISGLKIHFHDEANEIKNAISPLEEYWKKMRETKTSFEKYNSGEILKYVDNFKGNTENIKANKSRPWIVEENTNKTEEVKPSKESLSLWDKLKQKIQQIKPVVQNVKQATGGIGSIFSGIKQILPKMNGISGITTKITGKIKQMSTGMKQGLGHVLKYAGALFSLRGIYSVLSNSAQSWLSSQNTGAQQLSANIEYMKYAMGSVFAPVIQYVTNLVYQLMKAIQSVVYAFSGVNIFAKATASSMKSTSKSAKETNKSPAGVHSEINNVSDNNNSGSGSGAVGPSMDLSQVDGQMNGFAQKLYDFFKPLKESWDNYGQSLIAQIKTTAGQVGGLIASVWGSFENIITNGTAYSILENILAIIGNIAEAFKDAWNYNGNGDKIVQNLANAFNNLLVAINNVVQSPGFQDWLKRCSDKFSEISKRISEINWQPLIDALVQIGTNIGTIALGILKGLVEIFKWFVENPILAEILIALAIAIGIVSTAITIVTGTIEFFKTATHLLKIELLPLIGIIVAIIAVVALVILAIMNWDNIMNFLKQTVETVISAVVEFFTNLWSKVSFIFEAIWNVISTILGFIWNLFATVFQAIWNIVSPIINAIWQIISTIFGAIWNIISTILGSVWNIFSQVFNWVWQLVSKVFQGIWNVISPIMNLVWGAIKLALSKIQEMWSRVWNIIANVVNTVWNGIWSGIKFVINLILGGIEGFVNGAIKGINLLLKGVSKVANAIGSLIGLDPINLQINTVSLPRLAKGGVIDSPTVALMGEYAGANSNPEIAVPQNTLKSTFREEMSDFFANNNNNGQPIRVQLYLGTKMFIDEVVDGINEKTRQTGKAQIKVAY